MSGSIRFAAVAVAAITLSCVVIGGAAGAAAAPAPAYTPVPGSAAPFARPAAVTGSVPGATRLTVQVWLKPDIAAAETFATAVSTPGGARYGHYLSPAAYTAAFGPSAAAAGAVASWLRAEGFTGVTDGPGRAYVRATAPVSVIDAAFRTSLKYYRPSAGVSAGRYALRANSGRVSVPSSLRASVIGVTGLDNATPAPRKVSAPSRTPSVSSTACSKYYGQRWATGWPAMFGVTAFPIAVCGYHASQLRAAYGANGANSGKSQTIAMVEIGLARGMYDTLKTYASDMKLPAPSKTRYREISLGKGRMCDTWADEETLDVEASYAIAPSAHQLVVGGDSCDNGDAGLQSIVDADVAIVNGSGSRPLATIVSNSWDNGLSGETQATSLTSIEHAFLVQAAAEGVGMYYSTGDSSGVETPSSDPYAIAVGGTSLGLGKANNRLFETGWSTDRYLLSENGKSWQEDSEDGAAGGGFSLLWAQPSYQAGVVPAALATPPGDRGIARVIPDISADGDLMTGIAVLDRVSSVNGKPVYEWTLIGGTSLAAPLVAGMVADAQQGQDTSFGFINPALYRLAGTAALHDTLPVTSATPAAYRAVWCATDVCDYASAGGAIATIDAENTSMLAYTGQVTRKGYDTMTGLGTPNGQTFIKALRALLK